MNLMTDLIDSLLEFARTRESLNPAYANVAETIQRSVLAVRLHPRHHNRAIDVLCGTQVSGWFDQRKLERALYNLLLNACEALLHWVAQVEVTAAEVAGTITISVADNGPGIAESIHDRLFHPFVSYGKENGHRVRTGGGAENRSRSWRRDCGGTHGSGQNSFPNRTARAPAGKFPQRQR